MVLAQNSCWDLPALIALKILSPSDSIYFKAFILRYDQCLENNPNPGSRGKKLAGLWIHRPPYCAQCGGTPELEGPETFWRMLPQRKPASSPSTKSHPSYRNPQLRRPSHQNLFRENPLSKECYTWKETLSRQLSLMVVVYWWELELSREAKIHSPNVESLWMLSWD